MKRMCIKFGKEECTKGTNNKKNYIDDSNVENLFSSKIIIGNLRRIHDK
jgi:hypothetical protein